MKIKSGFGQLKELDAKGKGLAVFATLNVKDKDGDVTLPGAFGEQHVQMVGAHDWSSVPIGKTRIYEEGDLALADFQLNLETIMGKEWYHAMKFDLDHPPAKQEYSYGYNPTESESGDHNGERVRFLKRIEVFEVSPVLRGAGEGTRTLGLKGMSMKLPDHIEFISAELKRLFQRIESIREMRRKEGRDISPERLAQIEELHGSIEEIQEAVSDLTGMTPTPPQEANPQEIEAIEARLAALQADLTLT